MLSLLSQTSPRKRHKAEHDNPFKISNREWHELYDIYEAHYRYELPFLHKRSFLEYAIQVTEATSGSLLYPSGYEALLAFLSMTAHLHPEFALGRGCASATREYYTKAALRMIGDTSAKPSVGKVHALLMVGYQRWVGQGDSSGIDNIQLGIKYAQAITHERKQEEMTHQSDGENVDRAWFIYREIWNRTICSCCTLDLYISLMAQRPRLMMMEEDLIHLPCADRAFRFGREVKAGQPREDAETSKKREADTQECPYDLEEGALNLFMQSVFICGKIHDTSKEGPQNLDLDYFETEMRCQKEALPEELQLEPENTAAHLFEVESPGIYIRIHALYQLCIVEMERTRPTQPVVLRPMTEPFSEMLKSFQERQLATPRALIPIGGFAAYRISCTLHRMDPDAASERQIGITRTYLNAMRNVWGIATEWHDGLNSRKAYPVDLGNPGPHTKARDTPGSNVSNDVDPPHYRYDPIRDESSESTF